ncbi:sensor histidine kinase [Psychrobacter sp. AOP22-C1-22]|uniref:sensor histidine kinase n=1 Tax=Psychrobacter TaxID=497 RepID=UPI001787E6AF|nr:ATP-binding protein [Psychrobacter sp. FME6]MBE0407209.1 two-component sensor histidine kinase [Psychrobacter sp. FME6]
MIKKPLSKIRLTLFWRLFLSLLLAILFTALSSILIERWLNERALNARMEVQIERLLIKRELVVVALQTGEIQRVRQLYQDDRGFMNQISIYDEQGMLVFPKYNQRQHRKGKYQSNFRDNIAPQNLMADKPTKNEDRGNPDLINTIINIDQLRKIADTPVTLPNGETLIIQLRPNLPFNEVVALQRGNFEVRFLLIIIFSTLVCAWLSRTMIRRMRHVQHTVRQLINGNYQTDPSLINLGSDELGLLAKDVAKLADRLVDSELARKQMLSDISHELRSPLARLEVATELTRDFAPNAERYLDRIDKESTRMNELIEQIIHIQSLQMQQYSMIDSEKEQVNLIDLISDISQDVRFEFQNKNVTLEWQPSINEEDYWTFGNHKQLHSALENVIRNAFIHTLNDSAVTIKLVQIKQDHRISAVQISVADEGPGIADEDVLRIFEPFVRLDSARQRQTGGYGLGLAIAHAVIIAHKGKIKAYNRTDHQKGLVVQIELASFIGLLKV